MIGVAECFGPTSASNRESASQVAVVQTSRKVCATHKRVEKSRVEAVSCSHGIDAMRLNRRRREAVSAAAGDCTTRTDFHHNERYQFRQLVYSFVQAERLSDLLSFALVRKKDVYKWQDLRDPTLPLIGRIVVGVQRDGQARRS